MFSTDVGQTGAYSVSFVMEDDMPIAQQPKVFITLSCQMTSVLILEKISDNLHGFFTHSLFCKLIDEHFQIGRKIHKNTF